MLVNPAFIGLVMSLFSLLFGLYLYVRRNKFERSGIKVSAVVNEIIVDQTGDGKFYYPVVSFSTLTGQLIEEQYPIGSYPSLYQKGDEIQVVYLDEISPEFIIVGKKSRYVQTIFIVVGAIGLVASAVYIFKGI
jgi:hypothetical protein